MIIENWGTNLRHFSQFGLTNWASRFHKPANLRRASVRVATVMTAPLLVAGSIVGYDHFVSDNGNNGIAPVAKGSVQTSLDAVGTLQYLTRQDLDFPVSGKLVSLKVAVGDRVTPGQPVAETDNTEQRIALRKAQNDVTRTQAVLDRVLDDNQASGSKEERERVEDILDRQHQIKEEVDDANRSSIRQVERELEFDRADLAQKEERLAATPNLCTPVPVEPGCSRYEDRLKDVQDARRRVIQSKNRLRAARNKFEVDHLQSKAAIDQAQLTETTVENKVDLTRTNRKHTLDEHKAALDSAKAELELAQKNFDGTILKSSYSGSVFEINRGVGDVVPASVSSPLPSDNGKPVGTGAPSTTNAKPFMVIKDVNTFQVSVPFSSADAAGMRLGQPVRVGFDAVPGLERQAEISSITPADPQAKDTNFIVKMVLKEGDPRLADGMSAQVSVVTSSVDNVLAVPAAAVRRSGQSGAVTVLASDDSRREVPVELGAIGTKSIQIVSGLREGDNVVVPTGTS